MIIFYKHHNQLCNRLWAIIPAISLSLELNQRLIVLGAYKNYLKHFPNLINNHKILFILNKRKFFNSNLLLRFWSIFDKFRVNMSYTEINKNKKILILGGWEKRFESAYIEKNKKQIIELFQPNKKIIKKISAKLSSNKEVLNIGIHIRRGDYKDFFEGKYFYNIDFYYKFINECYNLFSNYYKNKKFKFLICSNEKFDIHDPKYFSLLNPSIKEKDVIRFYEDDITDLYALASCDFIAGPPSTFTQWASFIGKPRFYQIDNQDLFPKNICDFKKVKLLDNLE